MPEPSHPNILQITTPPPGARVVFSDGQTVDVVAMALVEIGMTRRVEPIIAGPWGMDLAGAYDEDYQFESGAGPYRPPPNKKTVNKEEDEDDEEEETFHFVPPEGDGCPWPTLKVARVPGEGDDTYSRFEDDPMMAKVIAYRRRSDALLREALHYPPQGTHVLRELRWVEDLREAIAKMPAGLEVMVSLDGECFSKADSLSLFVPPRSSPLDRPVLFLIPRGLAEDWDGYAEDRRAPVGQPEVQVVPAGGRDLGDEVAVLQAWNDGELFEIIDTFNDRFGKSYSKSSFRHQGICVVLCRYDVGTRTIALSTEAVG